MSTIKSFVKGVIFGGIIGATAGILLAPKKGTEMQEEAKEALGEIIKKGKKIEKEFAPQIKKAKRMVKKVSKKAIKVEKGVVRKAKKIVKSKK